MILRKNKSLLQIVLEHFKGCVKKKISFWGWHPYFSDPPPGSPLTLGTPYLTRYQLKGFDLGVPCKTPPDI